MPRFEAMLDDVPRELGFEGTAGPRDPDDEDVARVAIHVGKTNDGSELPAKLGQDGSSDTWERVVTHRNHSPHLRPARAIVYMRVVSNAAQGSLSTTRSSPSTGDDDGTGC
jgi:hypothetical protein